MFTETFVLRCGVYADETKIGYWDLSVFDDSLGLSCKVYRWDTGMWWELTVNEMRFKDNKGNSYSAIYENGWWRARVPKENVLPDSEFWPCELIEGSGQYVNSYEVVRRKVPSHWPWPEPEIEEEPEGVVTPFAILGDEHDRPIEEVVAEMEGIVANVGLNVSIMAKPFGGKTFAEKPGKMRCMGCGMIFDIEEVNVNIKYTSKNKLEYDLTIRSACCFAPLSREKPPEVEPEQKPISFIGLLPSIKPEEAIALKSKVMKTVEEIPELEREPPEPPKPKKRSRKKKGYACPVCGIRTTKGGKLFVSPRSVVIHARMAHGERLKEADIKKG